MRGAPLMAFCLATALLAACGSAGTAPAKPSPAPPSAHATAAKAAPPAPPAAQPAPAAKSLPKVTLLLDIPANGSMAPYFVALGKGYYRAAGLDMTNIIDGHGSVLTSDVIASGRNTFGYASADSAAAVISKGGPIRVVADWIQKNPAVVMFKSSAPIHKPTDLYGKRVGISPGTTVAQLWEAFEAATHLNPKRIDAVNMSISAVAGALADGRIAAMPIFGYSFRPQVERLGVTPRVFQMSNYGIDDLAGGIIVSDSTLKAHPGWVRDFLAATIRAYKFSEQHPDQAIAIERRYRPTIPAKVGVQELKLSFALLHTQASRNDPLGYMARKDWAGTVATAHRFEGMKKVLPLTDYYTNAYLPSAK